MDLREKIIYQQIEKSSEKLSYLKDIAIGIPDDEISKLKRNIKEAEDAISNHKNMIAKNKITLFDDKFSDIEDSYFSDLLPRQIDYISRSDQRPKILDYTKELFEDFEEIKGFESNNVDPAMVCGFAKLMGNNVMVIGHEKGGFNEDFRRGGSALPQGNQKAIQAMKLAEKFNIPVITFVDTPGSWPLEEFLPAQRIARNLEI